MSNVLRLAIVDPNDGDREALKATLMGLDTVWLEAECSRYAFFKDVVEETHPDVAFISMDADPEKAIELVEELARQKPEVALLVASSSTDGAMILRSMRAGAKEFLTKPLRPDDLATALQRIGRTRFGAEGAGAGSCRVIAVSGCTGGVGSTSLAINLGCELASNPTNSVVVLDLDLALGDADVYLDTIPEYTLTDVAQNIGRLDFTLLKRSLTKHSSGVYLLPRPVQLEDSKLVTTDDLTRVINLLRATFTHLIIDTSKAYNELDLLAMDLASDILMVTQLDLPCLRNVVRLMMSFEQRGALREKVKIVVNRVGQGGASISVKKAESTLGQDIFWQLPNDFRTMIEVRNNGVPLLEQAPKAPLTQSIQQLARELTGGSSAGESDSGAKSGRSWLGLWGKKGAAEEPASAEG
ncbi:Septum site-determining protein MinD [Botrimarina colliarenosi]|uniref:Septum site-determining protein MinD n=1 Tax=Botrimarina colliarenosi TaxID=2528001 RepID=A0A5C6A970_9BACT|nr:response regulator [Botrimarina colliarenosi]TWT95976.1 Septum site-determining protein MinD [Botrimarina colliarenosi]